MNERVAVLLVDVEVDQFEARIEQRVQRFDGRRTGRRIIRGLGKKQPHMHQYDRPAAGHQQETVADHLRNDLSLVVAHFDRDSMNACLRRTGHDPHFVGATDGHFAHHLIVDVEPRIAAQLGGHPQGCSKLHAFTGTRQNIALHATQQAPKTRVSPPAVQRCPEGTRGGVEDWACLALRDRGGDAPDAFAQVSRCLVVLHRAQYRLVRRLRR